VRTYLKAIKNDQGAMLQLSPEAMDLMLAGFADRPGVSYQSTVSMSPPPSAKAWLRTLAHPAHSLSLALFASLHAITAGQDETYPCAPLPAADAQEPSSSSLANEALLARALGKTPDLEDNDGCVPIRSQLWGTLVWAGLGDHLDVLGHYRDDTPEQQPELRHHDWLTSGSRFSDASFESLMDAVVAGMIESTRNPAEGHNR
jgi:hypothetical protein